MSRFLIETDALTRRFGRVLAVDHVALQVPAGCVYGFLGPNGAGKTTTIRMLLGLISPNEGQVYLFGKPLREQRITVLRRVGALVEGPSLYPNLTGAENLEVTRLLRGGSRDQMPRVLETVRLRDVAHRLVRTYSLGMKQRLALALALLGNPELLVLDEPTNGLDPAGIREMRALIRSLAEEHGLTVFLSSHLLGEVEQVANHIGIIHRGQLRFQAGLETLRQQRRSRVVLEVNRPDAARTLLEREGWTLIETDRNLLSVAASTPAEAGRINALLVEHGLDVYRLGLEKPSLEETFLQLTEDEAP